MEDGQSEGKSLVISTWVPNVIRKRFLTRLVLFICVPPETSLQHIKKFREVQ